MFTRLCRLPTFLLLLSIKSSYSKDQKKAPDHPDTIRSHQRLSPVKQLTAETRWSCAVVVVVVVSALWTAEQLVVINQCITSIRRGLGPQ